MRRLLGIIAAVGGIALLAAGPGLGGENKPAPAKETQACRGRGGRLGLTDEQAQKMRELKKARKEAVAPLRKKLKEEMLTLREQVRDEEGDKNIQATLERLQGLNKSIQAENEKFKTKVQALLTPSQQAKLLLARGRRQGPGGERGFGRHGGRGMRGGEGRGGPRGGGWAEDRD